MRGRAERSGPERSDGPRSGAQPPQEVATLSKCWSLRQLWKRKESRVPTCIWSCTCRNARYFLTSLGFMQGEAGAQTTIGGDFFHKSDRRPPGASQPGPGSPVNRFVRSSSPPLGGFRDIAGRSRSARGGRGRGPRRRRWPGRIGVAL